MSTPTERIQCLRQHALDHKDDLVQYPHQIDLWAGRAWISSSDEPWSIIRHALVTEAILTHLQPVIDPFELIAGKYDLSPLSENEETELSFFQEKIQPAMPRILGMKSHMAIDFDKLLNLGVSGIEKQIKRYRSRLELSRPDMLQKDVFYRACLITLKSLVVCAHHYSNHAATLARQTHDSKRKYELEEIANIFRHVPETPAKSFYEAIQCVHFVVFCLCAGTQSYLFQYGRPDRYLLPFFQRDLSENKITPAFAQELIDCLGIIQSEYTPQGLAVGWMVGGRDASGKDICNELTEMFLESIDHIRLPYPDVGLCWSPEIPEKILEMASKTLSQGLSHPAIFNDPIISFGLIDAGLPPAEACLYQNSTCVEITPVASSNVYVASPYINLLQILNNILGVPTLSSSIEGAVQSLELSIGTGLPGNYEELIKRYKAGLAQTVRKAVIDQNTHQATRYFNGGQPILSCFVNDCLLKGVDIDQGGARYNWIEPSFVGLANLVDSLDAIKQVVFENRSVGLEDLVKAMKADFKGYENLRQMLLNRIVKYGNDDDQIDDTAIQITQWIQDEVGKYRSFLGGKIISGFFTWIMHEQLGRMTPASADGRHAGFPLSAGSGAAQGCERKGPTAAVLSATKWNHSPHLGGIAVNLKFNKPRSDGEFPNRLLDVIKIYLERGGFEIQVNVVDRETLEAAQKNPEQYRDLTVRIGGYSDYFVRLSSEMQAEIIQRSEHEL